MTRGVRTNWDLVAKIKIERMESNNIHIDEKNLSNFLRYKEIEFNITVPTKEDEIVDHPTITSKYLKKFFKWK